MRCLHRKTTRWTANKEGWVLHYAIEIKNLIDILIELNYSMCKTLRGFSAVLCYFPQPWLSYFCIQICSVAALQLKGSENSLRFKRIAYCCCTEPKRPGANIALLGPPAIVSTKVLMGQAAGV